MARVDNVCGTFTHSGRFWCGVFRFCPFFYLNMKNSVQRERKYGNLCFLNFVRFKQKREWIPIMKEARVDGPGGVTTVVGTGVRTCQPPESRLLPKGPWTGRDQCDRLRVSTPPSLYTEKKRKVS